MLWWIIWDIIGSVYEWNNIKTENFPLFVEKSTFTDDSVLTIATADLLLNWWDYVTNYKSYTKNYPLRWYWTWFYDWVMSANLQPYNSFWNGSAMRVWPIWWVFDTLEQTLEESKKSAEVTHNHPEWIKWAQSVASAIFLARTWKSKEEIKQFIEKKFDYDLWLKLDKIRENYTFNETCQWTVPQAIIAFLESNSFEDAIRKGISLWGDSDTLTCITWSIAEAFYEIPVDIKQKARTYLDNNMNNIIDQFYERFIK